MRNIADSVRDHIRTGRSAIQNSIQSAHSWIRGVASDASIKIQDYSVDENLTGDERKFTEQHLEKKKAQDLRFLQTDLRDLMTSSDLYHTVAAAQEVWEEFDEETRYSIDENPLFSKRQIAWTLKIMSADLDEEDRAEVEEFIEEFHGE